jgi:HK97 family phage major capsid protein
MAIDTVASVINAIKGDEVALRNITESAVLSSAIARIKEPTNATSALQRYVHPRDLTAHVTNEGETKTIASGVLTAGYYQLLPISLIVPLSNTLTRTSKNLQDAVVKQMVKALSEGIDREILRNADGKFASSLVAAATAASNTKAAASATAITYAEMNDTFGLVNADGFEVTGVVVRGGNESALRASETTGGNRFFVPADAQRPNSIFGARTEIVSSRVLPMTASTGETMAVVGDFDYLDWSTLGSVDIKLSEDASAGVYNAFDQNLVLVRAELWFGFAVLDNNAFAILVEP